MEHFIDCGNCGRHVRVSRHRKKQRDATLCSECRRYVEIPVVARKQQRVIGKRFMASVTRPKSLRWGKNGRPLEKAHVKPMAIQTYDFGIAVAEESEE